MAIPCCIPADLPADVLDDVLADVLEDVPVVVPVLVPVDAAAWPWAHSGPAMLGYRSGAAIGLLKILFGVGTPLRDAA